jgi:hypothetical protein
MGIENKSSSNPNYVDLVKLIRSIQRAEGNVDCYRRGRRECEQMDCAWRDHCLMLSGGHATSSAGLREKNEGSDSKQKQG